MELTEKMIKAPSDPSAANVMEPQFVPLSDYIELKKKLDLEEDKTRNLRNVLVQLLNIETYETRKKLVNDALK